MATQHLNFTKSRLLSISSPTKPDGKKGGVFDTYKDTKEKGLILLVSHGGARTFYLYKKVDGKPERIRIGAFPDVTIENARNAAAKLKGEIAQGMNPNAEKNKLKQEVTFKELFDEYLERYSKKQKRSWEYDEREVNKFLPSWFKRKISSITRDEVLRLHEKIGDQNGVYAANRLLERIRAIFNKAIEWGWQGTNPASGVKKFPEKSRDRFIKPGELPFFFEALEEEHNTTASDYIRMSLYTGARKSNVLSMRWTEVDWTAQEWRIPETKNGESLTLPLLEPAIEILERRRKKTNRKWVFPSDKTEGHLADPKKAWKRILTNATIKYWKVHPDAQPLVMEVKAKQEALTTNELFNAVQSLAEKKDVELPIGLMDVRLHDLRRKMGSFQAASGSSLHLIGKSLGHKSQQATRVYSRLDLDPVRQSMDQAVNAMQKAGENGQ